MSAGTQKIIDSAVAGALVGMGTVETIEHSLGIAALLIGIAVGIVRVFISIAELKMKRRALKRMIIEDTKIDGEQNE